MPRTPLKSCGAPARMPSCGTPRIAAICLNHGVQELLTADRDFGYFPWLNAVNPLVESGR